MMTISQARHLANQHFNIEELKEGQIKTLVCKNAVILAFLDYDKDNVRRIGVSVIPGYPVPVNEHLKGVTL